MEAQISYQASGGPTDSKFILIDSSQPPPQPQPSLHNQLKTISDNPLHQSRIIINSIILQDFKSYAGRQVIGPLHRQFTSIVGPNGSGKSNLLQSLLFVFGFNASWVRQSKLSQLIHHSCKQPTKQRGSVQVEFLKILRDGNTEQVIDKFVIKRIVTKQSISKYFLNDKQISHLKLRQRLKHEGIDLTNNRFLILQGEVEGISQMKPKGNKEKPGMLQYLQEIIGSGKYLQQIEELVHKYSQLNQLKHKRTEHIKIVESEVKGMIGPKKQALEYIKVETKLETIKSILLQLQGHSLEDGEIRDVQSLEELEKQRGEIVKEEKQKLQKQKERIFEIKVNKKNIIAAEKDEESSRKTLEKLNLADKNLNKEIEFKSEDSAKYSQKVAALEKQLNQIIKTSQQLVQQMPQLQNQLQQTKAHYDIQKQEVSKYNRPELSQEIRKLEKSLKNNRVEFTALQQKTCLAEKQFEKMYAELRVNDERMKANELKIQDNEKMYSNIKAAAIKAQFVQKDLCRNLENYRKQERTYLQQISKIDSQISYLKQEKNEKGSINSMFSKIMEQKLPGVFGRLGDLGIINASTGNIGKYDEILTSCFGKKLDHIVVRDVEAAQSVIEYLKVHQLGRVSCIILDKIQQYSNYMRKSYHPPHRCIRLFDLIDVRKQEVRVAFYYLLNDTLFCQNSNEGLKYSMQDQKNRRRVISYNINKNGFIIFELNGLMNGCQKRKGGFQAKVRIHDNKSEVQIEELVKNKQAEESKLNSLRQKIDELINCHKQTESDITQLKKEKLSLELIIKNLRDDLQDLKKSNYSHLRDANSEEQKRQRQLEIRSLKSRLSELDEEHRQLADQLAQKQEEQKSLESQEIQQLRKKFNELKQQYQSQIKSINNKKAVLSTTKKKLDSLKQQKGHLSTKIGSLEKEITKMKKQRENMEKMAISILSKISDCEHKLIKLRKLDQQMRILLQEQNKEVLESKRKIQQIKARIDTVRTRLKNTEQLKTQNSKQLLQIRDNYQGMIEQYNFLNDLREIEKMRVDHLQGKYDGSQSATHQYLESLEETIEDFNPLKELTLIEISKFELLKTNLQSLKDNLAKQFAKYPPTDIRVLGQYRDKCREYHSKLVDLKNTENTQNSVRLQISKKKEQRLSLFLVGFNLINSKLKEVYQYLTKGGDAELQLVDTLDPFSDGISFSVRPNKKSWKQINKLSGGQKTLSSLSLILSLHHYRPNPIYFMDEIDAALDFRNVQIVANYLKKRTKDAQFIVISLRNNMFQVAERLIGIYKICDCTNVIEWEGEDETMEAALPFEQLENNALDIQSCEQLDSGGEIQNEVINIGSESEMKPEDIFD